MIFARKMPEFYIIIDRKLKKNIFPNFRGGGHVSPLPPSLTPIITTTVKLAKQKLKVKKVKKLKPVSCKLQRTTFATCSQSQRTVHIDGISPAHNTERTSDDRHHGRGVAHFLATFKFYCSCLLHVVPCSLQVLTFNF